MTLSQMVSNGELTQEEAEEFLLDCIEQARIVGQEDVRLELCYQYLALIGLGKDEF